MINEEAAPRTSAVKRVLTYGVTLVVAAIAIYGISEFLTPVQPPKQGDCVSLTGDVGRYEAADCSANANYVVEGTVAAAQSCPNGADMSWVPVRRIDPKVRFCLAPLYDVGECYPEARSGYDLDAVDCGDQDVFKVTKGGRDAPAPSCGPGEETRSYPAVKLTYCLSRA
ncbi:hypothetical protein ABZX92_17000 [Lentzea sp. NPDC006480]|uniref:LppU/SCO3897 family protein n=1 Tax=Lentzea sp. NPDC006480 TaxID=3157176 RepID=UPI0033BC3607